MADRDHLKTFHIEREGELARVAEDLKTIFRPGDCVSLVGDLGAGKTTLTRAFLRALGFEGAVASPTYPLLLEYEFEDFLIVHIDGYRLAGGEDPWDWRDWRNAIVLVEWAEKTQIPQARFTYRLQIEALSESERLISLQKLDSANRVD